MTPSESLSALRVDARAFEQTLPMARRKSLGQFFTGTKVSRLLAHLAIDDETRSVLDPMAGTGDLLEGVAEAASHHGSPLDELTAIEIDAQAASLCQRRLSLIADQYPFRHHVVYADAFTASVYEGLPHAGYDLVVANPPYVRYQSMNGRGESMRKGLAQIVVRRLRVPAREVWSILTANYSGLADLSVPAWLLCASMVRPGGRLALVSPATWRSRNYAHVVRYLLLRAFELEIVVEDSGHCWFPDALVGTHLIVARRLRDDVIEVPLQARTTWHSANWIAVAPNAASSESIIGSAFQGRSPESSFAKWCRDPDPAPRDVLVRHPFPLQREWTSLRIRAKKERWLGILEPEPEPFGASPLSTMSQTKVRNSLAPIPEALSDLLPTTFLPGALRAIGDLEIRVGQGLRTGCNRFFYVEVVEQPSRDWCTVITSKFFGARRLRVPTTALRPIVHRQSEISQHRLAPPRTRVLDLRHWALPEDMPAVAAARSAYVRAGQCQPQTMPDELAQYVRDAQKPLRGTAGKSVPEFSAVRTNVRQAKSNLPPRFWYMLPDFTPRHSPSAFVPRIVQHTPRAYANNDPHLLVDANFSTFRSDDSRWNPQTLTSLLNSTWCRCFMEASGTRLGGGALKLEASHHRHLLVPSLSGQAFDRLKALTDSPARPTHTQIDRIILGTVFPMHTPDSHLDAFVVALDTRARELRAGRQRSSP